MYRLPSGFCVHDLDNNIRKWCHVLNATHPDAGSEAGGQGLSVVLSGV